jgi:hypothetical protein
MSDKRPEARSPAPAPARRATGTGLARLRGGGRSTLSYHTRGEAAERAGVGVTAAGAEACASGPVPRERPKAPTSRGGAGGR